MKSISQSIHPKVTITLWKETHTCVSNLVYRPIAGQQLLMEQSVQNQSDCSTNNARINPWLLRPHQWLSTFCLGPQQPARFNIRHLWEHPDISEDLQMYLDALKDGLRFPRIFWTQVMQPLWLNINPPGARLWALCLITLKYLELGPEEKENSQNRSSIFGKEIRAGFLSQINSQMRLLQNTSNLI